MKNHVTSLEVSKELSKILPNLKSELLWYSYGHHYHESDGEQGINWSNCEIIGRQRYKRLDYNKNRDDLIVGCPALLLTEVLELLPMYIRDDDSKIIYQRETLADLIVYMPYSPKGVYPLKGIPFMNSPSAPTKSEQKYGVANAPTAAARLAIWLVENGYELNKEQRR